MRFQDVPVGCHVAFDLAHGRKFYGIKIEEDMAQWDRGHNMANPFRQDFVVNILPTQSVTVLVRNPWRLRLLTAEVKIHKMLGKVCRWVSSLVVSPSTFLLWLAYRGLNYEERGWLSEQTRPLTDRVRHHVLQSKYDEAFGKPVEDVPEVIIIPREDNTVWTPTLGLQKPW